MAWRCTGKSNEELISNLGDAGIFKSEQVAKAMAAVDRANYVRHTYHAYEDSPQYVHHTQV
ncbi:hypothetical protein DXG03_004269 [Asterophora parasitica]|uniref:protein-L-isoaspartate(D-aspartate) O-methyltransferase n=1 Tax=Asterophora parasitica TaxID=117018 RepID=A0A9P7KA62_9AGAR|nr:hypothetical protein DXG03_004269 [Asterophora parasitica]